METILINLDDAIEAISKNDSSNGTIPVFTGKQVINILKKCHTSKKFKGNWITIMDTSDLSLWECSNCGIIIENYKTNYCSDCGCEMEF